MDITALAPAAVALLAPYLAKGAEEFAKTAGKAVAEKAGQLYQVLKKKFRRGSYAAQTLARVEAQPESPPRQAALEGVLVDALTGDTALAAAVRRILEAAPAGGDVQTATGNNIAQADHGSTASVNVELFNSNL